MTDNTFLPIYLSHALKTQEKMPTTLDDSLVNSQIQKLVVNVFMTRHSKLQQKERERKGVGGPEQRTHEQVAWLLEYILVTSKMILT